MPAVSDLVPLIVPGWRNSGPRHWQSYWELLLPQARRVQQRDWEQPDPADWVAQLDAAVASLGARQRAVLIAHSLGCATAVRWAAEGDARNVARIAAGFLVAPADVERPLADERLAAFAPLPQAPLPFPTLVVGSTDDAVCSGLRAQELARRWRAECRLLPQAGHINAESGHTQWPEGLALLRRFVARVTSAIVPWPEPMDREPALSAG